MGMRKIKRRHDFKTVFAMVILGLVVGICSGVIFVDDHTKSSVFEVDRPRASPEHPTMKPLDLVRQMVENSSKAGDIVYDPFGGSGTTLLTCEATGRKGRTIEFMPAYCDVIIQRFENATGKTAELVSNGNQSS